MNTLWTTTLTDYRNWMRTAAMSPHTIYLRTYQLRRLADTHPNPWTITTDQLAAWLASHHWSPSTIRSWRSMLGSFYRWAVTTSRTTTSPAAALPRPPRIQLRARPAPPDVVEEALATSDQRLALMVRLARHGGLRRGEIATVHTDDLLGEPDGWWLIVHGKGSKDRFVPLDDPTVAQLHRWMDGREGWVFPGQIDGHLAPATVGRMISKHLGGKWTAHTLRHRYATEVWRGSHDLLATPHNSCWDTRARSIAASAIRLAARATSLVSAPLTWLFALSIMTWTRFFSACKSVTIALTSARSVARAAAAASAAACWSAAAFCSAV